MSESNAYVPFLCASLTVTQVDAELGPPKDMMMSQEMSFGPASVNDILFLSILKGLG